MDLFDRRILAVLRDGKSRNFQQVLSEVGFSYNTLRLHLAQLVEHGLVVRRKRPQQALGDPGSPTPCLKVSMVGPSPPS